MNVWWTCTDVLLRLLFALFLTDLLTYRYLLVTSFVI